MEAPTDSGNRAAGAADATATRYSRVGNYFEARFLRPYFGAVTTSVGALAGYLGATWDEPISRSSNFVCQRLASLAATAGSPWLSHEIGLLAATFKVGTEFRTEAWIFLLLIAAFGWLFGGTLWAQARSAARATEELKAATGRVDQKTDLLTRQTQSLETHTTTLEESSARLTELVRELHTLPPRGFLYKYGDAIPDILSPWLLPFDYSKVNQGVYEGLLKSQFRVVLEIVSAFVDEPGAPRYGCNIMAYRTTGSIDSTEAATIEASRLQFHVKGETPLEGLSGILDVQRALSASLNQGTFACPDPKLVDIALPVPEAGGQDTPGGPPPRAVLPGAPETFLTREPRLFRGPEDIEKVGTNHSFPDDLVRQWRQFFEANRSTIVSFMSFPLYAPGEASSSVPIGILNVHRNVETDWPAQKMSLLAPLLAPVLAAMGALLVVHLKRRGAILELADEGVTK